MRPRRPRWSGARADRSTGRTAAASRPSRRRRADGGGRGADGATGSERPRHEERATINDARWHAASYRAGRPVRNRQRRSSATVPPRRPRPTTRDRATRRRRPAAIASAELPEVRLLTDPADRESYRHDETAYLHGRPARRGRAPRDRRGRRRAPAAGHAASRAGRAARRRHGPVRRRGGNRGRPDDRAHAHEPDRRDRPENLCVIMQPGVINADLKAAVAAEGLFYPPDPASYEMCSIGGNLGTNAGGLCCVKYGQTRDWVLGLEVVLADGTVIRTGGRNVKDAAGYSLTHLFVGSRGRWRSSPRRRSGSDRAPPPRSTLLAFFATLDAAGDAVAGDDPCGARRRSRWSSWTGTRSSRSTTCTSSGLDRDAAAMLMVESDAAGRRGRRGDGRRRGRIARGRRHRDRARRGPARRPTGCARRAGSRCARSSGWGPCGWRTSASRARGCPSCSRASSGSPRPTASASRPSGTPATATCTRT